jgi:hypothetical protein
MGIDPIQPLEVVAGGVLDGRGRILADVQAQQHGRGASARAEGGALHIGDKGVKPVVVEAQAVDQGACLGQAEQSWLRVARLRQRRDRAHLDKAKTHRAQAVDAAGVLVQAGRQAHAVGELQPRQHDRVFDAAVAVRPGQRRALRARQGVQRQFMGGFGIQPEQEGAGEGVGEQRH